MAVTVLETLDRPHIVVVHRFQVDVVSVTGIPATSAAINIFPTVGPGPNFRFRGQMLE